VGQGSTQVGRVQLWELENKSKVTHPRSCLEQGGNEIFHKGSERTEQHA
jgi:hypothetical protein